MPSNLKRVEKFFASPKSEDAPSGHYKVGYSNPPHPADGMTATISFGGGAYGCIINPQSFADGGPEWVMRYGAPERIRYTVASLLDTFDYILSDAITMKDATERLRIMRAVRRALEDSNAE